MDLVFSSTIGLLSCFAKQGPILTRAMWCKNFPQHSRFIISRIRLKLTLNKIIVFYFCHLVLLLLPKNCDKCS